MDNFRRYRRPNGRTATTDGFIGSPKQGEPVGLQPRSPQTPAGQRKIGDFRSKEGFHTTDRAARPINRQAPPPNRPRQPARDTYGAAQGASTTPPEKPKRFQRLSPFRLSNWSKRKAFAVFAVMLLIVGGFFGGKAWLRFQQVFEGGGKGVLQEDVDPLTLRGEGDGRVNVLMLGRGGAGHEGADLTDTIIVASINVIQKEAALLSIPRDLYVQTSSGSSTKINSVFTYAKENALAASPNPGSEAAIKQAEEAGFKAVEDVIESVIGIPMHYHGMIDFDGFRKGIDTIGGVDINVPESGVVHENLRLYGQNYVLDVQEGPQHFDGLRALAYSRSRYASARGDFDRAERQRMVLLALKSKVLSVGTFSNPLKVSRLMDDFGNHIRTNLSLDDIMRLYEIGKGFKNDAIASVGLADPPNDYVVTDNVEGLSVVVPKAGVGNYAEIQHFVRNRLRDGFLAKEDAKVAILNGTTIPGLAARTATDLKSYGYNVTQITDAPTRGYHTTMVIDLTNGAKKYTRRYLENRFVIDARTRLPDPMIQANEADFVIILGQNEQTRLAN